jgi:hypothetical protein
MQDDLAARIERATDASVVVTFDPAAALSRRSYRQSAGRVVLA